MKFFTGLLHRNCKKGGFALNANAVDKRVKAVATTSMYNMSRLNARGYFDGTIPEQHTEMLEQMSIQRCWEDAKNGTPKMAPQGLPNEIKGDEP